MKKLLLISLLIAFSLSTSAQVYHEANVSEEGMQLNTTVKLECTSECPVNRWNLEWQIPESAEITRIEDSIGEIENYNVIGDRVEIETNSGERRMNETVEIRMAVSEPSEEIYKGLFKRKISLPGFQGENTTGVIHVEDLISGWRSYGFKASYKEDSMNFQGEGPVSLRVKFGEGNETDYYSFFGDFRGNVSQAYEISIGVTGLQQGFKRFPVASMPSHVYNSTANRWSAGEYIAGSMMIRDDLEDYIPILAHETVHGLNERELNWDETSSNYFEEGTAEYVEFLVREKLSAENRSLRPSAELFGDDVKWDPDPSDSTYRLLSSKGDADRLWNYYQNDRDFMKEWSSMKPANRRFGYAYSELMIRNYIADGGRLSKLYDKLNVTQEIDSHEEKWDIYSDHLDMRPCERDTREEFNQCLENVREYNYSIYSAKPSTNTENLTVRRIDIPEAKTSSATILDELKYSFSGLIDYIQRFLEDVLGS